MSDAPDSASVPIEVLSGSPTDEETAAIAALFGRLLLERAAAADPLPHRALRSAWERTARPMRETFPVERDWRDH